MKLLRLQDAVLTHLDVRFRQSPLALLIPSLIFFSITAGIVYKYLFDELPLCAAIPSGGFTLIFGLMVFSSFRKSLAPTNWFLAIGPDRVLVKFRSYLNAHFPAQDPQVISLDPSEIAFSRITKQRVKAPGRKGNQTSFHIFLDLYVPSVDLSPLKERLKYERTIKAQKMSKYVSAKARHYPVSVVSNDTIRIEWPGIIIYVAPGIKKALSALEKQGVTIEYPQKEVIDLTARGRSNLKSAEDKILYLAERGNLLAATKLARRTYKLSLAEAKQFVEDLLK